MANAFAPFQIITQQIHGVLNQVGNAPIIASSSWYDNEFLAFYSAGTSNAVKQATTNEALIVGVALGGSANTLANLVGSGSPATLISDNVMGTISNVNQEYYKSIDVCPFEITLNGKVLAASDMLAQYGITRVSGTGYAFWVLDSTKTGTSVRCEIIGFQNSDIYHGGIGDSGARVVAKVLASYSAFYITGGGEF
jgi:hypothetical protein